MIRSDNTWLRLSPTRETNRNLYQVPLHVSNPLAILKLLRVVGDIDPDSIELPV
jgi:hypothetical protein